MVGPCSLTLSSHGHTDLAHCSRSACALTRGCGHRAQRGPQKGPGRECGWTSAAEKTQPRACVPPGQPARQERPELGRQRRPNNGRREGTCAHFLELAAWPSRQNPCAHNRGRACRCPRDGECVKQCGDGQVLPRSCFCLTPEHVTSSGKPPLTAAGTDWLLPPHYTVCIHTSIPPGNQRAPQGRRGVLSVGSHR